MPSAAYMHKAAMAAKYGPGLVGLWKRGMNEIPEVVASSIMGFIGLCGVLYVGYQDLVKENRTKRFKTMFTIMRPEDKMVKYLEPHRKDNSPSITSTPPGFVPTKIAKANQDCGPHFKYMK